MNKLWENDDYIGPREGRILVYRAKISKELIDHPKSIEVIRMAEKQGKLFVERATGAIHRVGCTCCYGDGPNLDIEWDHKDTGEFNINYYVDFDFKCDDQVHSD